MTARAVQEMRVAAKMAAAASLVARARDELAGMLSDREFAAWLRRVARDVEDGADG